VGNFFCLSLLFSLQMVAHNKRYMDFVDFSLIYLQLVDAEHLV